MKMYGASYGFGSGSVFIWDGITVIFVVEAFRCSYICLIYKRICDSNLPKREVVEFHRSPYATPVSYNKVKEGYPSVYQSPGRKKIGENMH